MPVLDAEALMQERITAIQKYHTDHNRTRAQINIRGTVPDSVVLMLLSKALGSENVTANYTSSRTDYQALNSARQAAWVAGTALVEIDAQFIHGEIIGHVQSSLCEAGIHTDKQEHDSEVRSLITAGIQALIARVTNKVTGSSLRYGCGTEDDSAYIRLYHKSIGEPDVQPLLFLSHGEVMQLAVALGTPVSVLHTPPTIQAAQVLGMPTDGHPMHSVVDTETGKYVSVGLIERLNRFCSGFYDRPDGTSNSGDMLYYDSLSPTRLDELIQTAVNSPMFWDVDPALVVQLLTTARKHERETRHKDNALTPMLLSDRHDLVDDKTLTNDLGDMTNNGQ